MKNLINKNNLLILGGLGLAVTGAVLMKKASLKSAVIMEARKQDLDTIEACDAIYDDYTEEDKTKDIVIVNTQATIKLAKIYAFPAGIFIAGSCVAVNRIMTTIYKKGDVDNE